MSTPWLLLIVCWGHMGYLLFEPRHQWPAFASGLGLLAAALVWAQRGPRRGARWFLCAWGAVEGLQVFLCQGAQVWARVPGPDGMCAAYTGWPLLWWGLWAVAVIAYWIAMEARDG